jgi:hypothetical protein
MPPPPSSTGSGSGDNHGWTTGSGEPRVTQLPPGSGDPAGTGSRGPDGIAVPGDRTTTQPREGSEGTTSHDSHDKIQPLPIPSNPSDPGRDPNRTPVVPVAHPPVNPTPPGSGSTPVEINVPTPSPAVYKPSQVKVYDEVRHLCTPTDTMQTISQYYYKDARFADALLTHNRNHALANPALKSDPPVLRGAYIYVPDLWVLQEKYPQLISGATGVSVPPGR